MAGNTCKVSMRWRLTSVWDLIVTRSPFFRAFSLATMFPGGQLIAYRPAAIKVPVRRVCPGSVGWPGYRLAILGAVLAQIGAIG